MKWFIVTCRIAFDDEDTTVITQAEDADAAAANAESELREEREPDPDPDNDAFFVNYIVECDTEPRYVRVPQ